VKIDLIKLNRRFIQVLLLSFSNECQGCYYTRKSYERTKYEEGRVAVANRSIDFY
ncbi:hypothetical protein LCGC14_2671320, partial [marine sediment metagenome]